MPASFLGAVIFDPQGNLYTTSLNAGMYNSGTVFELSPPTGSTASDHVLERKNYLYLAASKLRRVPSARNS